MTRMTSRLTGWCAAAVLTTASCLGSSDHGEDDTVCEQARERYDHFADLTQLALARDALVEANDYYDLSLGVIARNCQCFAPSVYELWGKAGCR